MTYPKIRGLDAIPIEIIGDKSFAISEGKTKTHKSVFLRIYTDDPKVDGVSEIVCAPPGKPEEIQHEIYATLKVVLEKELIGISAVDTFYSNKKIDELVKGKVWT